MFRLFDFQCSSCQHPFEALVSWDYKESKQIEENPPCPECKEVSERCLHNIGTAHAAQIDPAKQRKMMMETAEMRNKMTGKTPWRRNSESQTD